MPNPGFFKRRKILRSTNALDLIPIALVEYEENENGKLRLLIPRFKSKFLENIFTGKNKSKYFRISLDETGSQVWKLIDGSRSLGTISESLTNYYKEKNTPFEDAEKRVVAFVTRLYQEGYVSFGQLNSN